MPENEVLEFYNLKGTIGKLRYGFRFVWRFILDKVAFFCFIKSWRTTLHSWRGVNVGKGVYIGHEVLFDRVFTDQIFIGDHTSIGDRSVITAHANIPSNTRLKKLYPRKVMPVHIGNGVWIMPNVIIAPGVTIGDEAVIATGSVVTKDIPARCLAAGVPAKVVKDFSDDQVFREDG